MKKRRMGLVPVERGEDGISFIIEANILLAYPKLS